ncbi:hypothetical protein JB92DRAFT_1111738 [Gautieria morchelliformis]|nr:hypothetical protein JB92DRAFT_1111738 [Gautieria morchelliformis]
MFVLLRDGRDATVVVVANLHRQDLAAMFYVEQCLRRRHATSLQGAQCFEKPHSSAGTSEAGEPEHVPPGTSSASSKVACGAGLNTRGRGLPRDRCWSMRWQDTHQEPGVPRMCGAKKGHGEGIKLRQ